MDETDTQEGTNRKDSLPDGVDPFELTENASYYSKIGDLSNRTPNRATAELDDIATEDIEEIRRIFNVFDGDNNGQITANEVRHVIRSLGQSTTEAEAMDIMNSIGT